MTDIEVQWHDATIWQDLTNHVTGFSIDETGIKRISQATINFECLRTNMADFLSNPFRLIRIKINPAGTWQNIFFGYVNSPFVKETCGTIENRVKVSLDCLNGASRLANDHITFDYFKLQSAIAPLVESGVSWTYRRMLEDILSHPDSIVPTGFEVISTENPNGIDKIIDTSCSWQNETLFSTIRTVCDRIGYDGYYYLPNESSNWQIKLFPFNKNSIHTFSGSFKNEPELCYGNLNNIANIIFVTGDIDSGVPADSDRWSEYGVSKYNPKAWTMACSEGTPAMNDNDNTVFSEAYRVNNKCIVTLAENANPKVGSYVEATLDLDKIESGLVIDTVNRCTNLVFNFKMLGSELESSYNWELYVSLTDTVGTKIVKRILGDNENGTTTGFKEKMVNAKLKDIIYPSIYTNSNNVWVYSEAGSSSFDWERIQKTAIKIKMYNAPISDYYGFAIDGLQFMGGLKIEPFAHYSALLNPAIYDQTSINKYGIHSLHLNDSNIESFEQAQAEGNRLLSNLKEPIATLTSTQEAPSTQIWPSNVVTVNGSQYRVESINYTWMNRNKSVLATFKAINKLSPLPPIWTEENYIRYLVK